MCGAFWFNGMRDVIEMVKWGEATYRVLAVLTPWTAQGYSWHCSSWTAFAWNHRAFRCHASSRFTPTMRSDCLTVRPASGKYASGAYRRTRALLGTSSSHLGDVCVCGGGCVNRRVSATLQVCVFAPCRSLDLLLLPLLCGWAGVRALPLSSSGVPAADADPPDERLSVGHQRRNRGQRVEASATGRAAAPIICSKTSRGISSQERVACLPRCGDRPRGSRHRQVSSERSHASLDMA